jgi:lipopolysaccharide/colanic/teichoic acid biosynthesis glycosyltransferase
MARSVDGKVVSFSHAVPAVGQGTQPCARHTPGFYERRLKRAADLVLGTLLFAALMPLIAAISLVIVATSGRPVFYGSERIGKDGRRFFMWKFRTMVADADAQYERWKETHPHLSTALSTEWKLEKDPRVTTIGRILRKTSLDELPQFWNVLCGEMSIVGPRPYLPRETLDPELAEQIHAVKPGLTGPFQIRGRKGLTPRRRMELEASYAPRVSLLHDAGYMLRTVKPLLKLDGE